MLTTCNYEDDKFLWLSVGTHLNNTNDKDDLERWSRALTCEQFAPIDWDQKLASNLILVRNIVSKFITSIVIKQMKELNTILFNVIFSLLQIMFIIQLFFCFS
ncbi:hypothetical protein HZH68_011224 [Vespula germanica]|uniref:Uncharacterized protein n=1 Tax=Vespula germanica TaxID=30212 RepID=A0A834JUC6_VESGE|nr:hypothetical protein HZH68_011224 [Vespula germanica]